MGKADPFGFVGVEKRFVGAVLQHVRYFPAEVDGIADSGVHTLTACRTMDVACIANKESAPHPKFIGNAMVDAIGRKPIHFRDFDIEKTLSVVANVFKIELIA